MALSTLLLGIFPSLIPNFAGNSGLLERKRRGAGRWSATSAVASTAL